MRRRGRQCGADGASKSFAGLRLRPIQAKNRSTTQRRGLTAKPTWSGFLRTISTAMNVAVVTIDSGSLRGSPSAMRRSGPRNGLWDRTKKEKHEPASDIDTVVVDSLKALDPKRPIREADSERTSCRFRAQNRKSRFRTPRWRAPASYAGWWGLKSLAVLRLIARSNLFTIGRLVAFRWVAAKEEFTSGDRADEMNAAFDWNKKSVGH